MDGKANEVCVSTYIHLLEAVTDLSKNRSLNIYTQEREEILEKVMNFTH